MNMDAHGSENRRVTPNLNTSFVRIRVHLWLTIFCFLCGSLALAESPMEVRGVSLAHLHRSGLGYGSDDCRKQLEAIKATGANWVAINDFAYMERVDGPELHFGRDRTMAEADLRKVVLDARELGLKVLVKPHVWSREFWNSSKWHGDIAMTSESDWDAWFQNYGQYLLYNARIAADTGAESLCLGVEYQGTTTQEARWRALIAKVREVYSGPITYAAAWAEWQQIKWWDAVDCIGVDAYFPLTDKPLASDRELRAGWAKVYAELATFSRQWGKPICFTEIGYSPCSLAGKQPWAYCIVDPDGDYQARLYRVALEEAAKREWVVGLFVWKWFTSDRFRRHEGRDPFAMQDREPVLEVLRGAWSR